MTVKRSFYRKKRYLIPGILILLIGILILWYALATSISPPVPKNLNSLDYVVKKQDDSLYTCQQNWLKQSRSGLWELYLEGSPFERGVINGKLTKQLIYEQEEAFISQIRKMIPSNFYLHFLKYFIYWFNRDLDRYLMKEYKEEIYGISFSASDVFNFIGTPYQRMLNYHSAHDIGHALQDLMLVGCTSFGVWNEYSNDSSLLIGRNFDFYMGDDFAKNKIVCFTRPDNGYAFMMVTWGGMIGTVSGMNEKGLTVTINAAQSEIPLSARTPISILAREILQYAATIEDAYHISLDRETFVSESLLIGSGDENRAAVIEKAPFGLMLVEPSNNYLICTNHFQSDTFKDDPLNQENIRDNASLYRSKRVVQQITMRRPMDVADAATLLRDQLGLNDKEIGLGNEKAINQLIAHHSIIFKPHEKKVWISTSPYQLGEYVCYDLTKIFNTFAPLQQQVEIIEADQTIPADEFLQTAEYQSFLRFREMRLILLNVLKEKEVKPLDQVFFDEFHTSNPNFYEVWSLSGDYFRKAENPKKAIRLFRKALTMEIPRWSEKEKIIRSMTDCRDQINDVDE